MTATDACFGKLIGNEKEEPKVNEPKITRRNFHALRHDGNYPNNEEESIPIGASVNVTHWELGNVPESPVFVVEFDYDGSHWDAIFDGPDNNGLLEPIATFDFA